jgi:hypothetical protein
MLTKRNSSKKIIDIEAETDDSLIERLVTPKKMGYRRDLERWFNPNISFRSLDEEVLRTLFEYHQTRIYIKILFEERRNPNRKDHLPVFIRAQPLLERAIIELLDEKLKGKPLLTFDAFYYWWKMLDTKLSKEEININFANTTHYPFWKKHIEQTVSLWSKPEAGIGWIETLKKYQGGRDAYRWLGLTIAPQPVAISKNNNSGRRPFTPEERLFVYQRAGGICLYCLIPLRDPREPNGYGYPMWIDHMYPRSTHPDEINNKNLWIAACQDCNMRKGTSDHHDFARDPWLEEKRLSVSEWKQLEITKGMLAAK